MKLTVLHRILLLNMLPKEGDYATLKLLRKLRESLSFDEAKNAQLQFRQEGETLHWNVEGQPVKEVEIGITMSNLLQGMFKKLDQEKKLTETHMDLYEMFVEK